MKIDYNTSSEFQGVILELICSKLNMMLTETFQLNQEIDFSNYEKLTRIVLKEIALGNVQSVHMTPREAAKAIKLLKTLECHDEVLNSIKYGESCQLYNEFDNPFINGPY